MEPASTISGTVEPSTSFIEPAKYQAIILGNIFVPLKRSLLSPEGFKLSLTISQTKGGYCLIFNCRLLTLL